MHGYAGAHAQSILITLGASVHAVCYAGDLRQPQPAALANPMLPSPAPPTAPLMSCRELLREPGVTMVELGRRAVNERVVSQDLELWITKEEVEDGWNMVARAGTALQVPAPTPPPPW